MASQNSLVSANSWPHDTHASYNLWPKEKLATHYFRFRCAPWRRIKDGNAAALFTFQQKFSLPQIRGGRGAYHSVWLPITCGPTQLLAPHMSIGGPHTSWVHTCRDPKQLLATHKLCERCGAMVCGATNCLTRDPTQVVHPHNSWPHSTRGASELVASCNVWPQTPRDLTHSYWYITLIYFLKYIIIFLQGR